MGILSDIKAAAAKAGSNKSKIIYFRENQKTRIRFLVDMEDGIKVSFHDSFEKGINVPCQEIFDRECPYCGDDTLRTRDQYIWSIYDVENNESKLLMAPVNNCSPIPSLIGMYEAYETLTDRDYVITKIGKQQNTHFSVVPLDKAKFRNAKAKPFSESAILKILDEAYPIVEESEDEDDEEEIVRKKKKKDKAKVKTKTKKNYEEDDEEEELDEDDEEFDEDDEVELDYDEMSRVELYNLCKERNIECEKRKTENYYKKLLIKWDKQKEDWDEDEE